IDIDGAAEADRYRDEIYLQAYADAEQVVVFASSWNLDASQVGTELSFTLPGHFVSATVTTLDTASNDPFNPNGAPILAERTISPLASSADVTLTFDASYQIHRVVYERLTGEYVVGTAAAEARKGGDDSDRILGRNGDDTLSGGAGSDTLLGQGSDDDIRGGRGDDLSIGGRGDDMLIGGQGADDLRGGKGDDLIRGGGGRDTLKGGGGSDELRGGGGRDELFGGSGSDELRGGAGADRLVAGGGDDFLFGGGGADRFEFSATNSTHRVADYAEGVDLLVFDGIDAAGVSLTTRGGDAIVEAGGLTVIVEDAAQLELGDLLFV
ncbi:MAG: calcium-binding protein, partial [Pseudomonadota bacterium]